MEHTSVPQWALEPLVQPLDPRASRCTILSYAAAPVAARWTDGLDELSIPHRTLELAPREQASPDERRRVDAELRDAVVGWRLLIAGALLDVLGTRSLALGAGLLDAEIIVGTTSVEALPVTCAHCETTMITSAAIAEVISCRGCQEELLVHHHVSRRRGSFLGFKNDAEEWAPEGEAVE
ncbi:dimethylamine monooxygenase subunit DmmA family protein [Nesterenkonia lutea]|uniref:Dimethylamine monooxygenase subunit DmmA-like C-terminal domain-containing protein n=1 Tax=Nesterenkonia lutea TaxID=272919 RepID=A0ABR9JH80_9MICC|nr:dimethylamine monooxygenase subunit DmmA family protein [Nesterenkonia lutea]MBE1525133.1 hypothetical protein [Nesterenkonia lutea]